MALCKECNQIYKRDGTRIQKLCSDCYYKARSKLYRERKK